MIKPGSITIVGTEAPRKYLIEYEENGPRELIVTHVVAKIITAAIEQGKTEVRKQLKELMEG